MKQAIVVRRDLNMGRGKAAAQVAHAACEALVKALREGGRWKEWAEDWLAQGQKKVILRVDSREVLEEIYRRAAELGLPSSMIEDAGLTQLPPGTVTAVAVGPAPAEMVDRITGHLKLF
ncbi:MAG: peptidyl-tRNA hydrolase Pth2 [Acidilobus sp.]